MRKGRQRTATPHLCIHTDPTELLADGTPDPDYTYSHRCTCLNHRHDHPSTEGVTTNG